MELYDVVIKLVGSIEPIGRSAEDNRRLRNLMALTELVDLLLGDISNVAINAERHESSMRIMGEHAKTFLDNVKEV